MKMKHWAFVLLAIPLTLYASQNNLGTTDQQQRWMGANNFPFPQQSTQMPWQQQGNPSQVYNPMQSPDENASSSSFELDSSMLGWQGPFSLSTTYSQNYGVIFHGQFTHSLGLHNAVSVILEGGAKTFRVNASWGVLLTKNQRIKLSIEHFMQKMDFDFASGTTHNWVAQNAIGATYQYLLDHGWLRSFHVNGFLSKAQSKNLGIVDYTGQDDLRYANYRNISGGEERSVGAGFTFLPTHFTELDATLNYQAINYKMINQSNEGGNTRGFGFQLTLHQLINSKLEFNLLYDREQAQNTYGAGFEVLLPSPHGTALDLKFAARHLQGLNGLPSDNQLTAGIDFRWGVTGPGKLTFSPGGVLGDLTSWVAEPAVYMDQVLALKDEKSVLLSNPDPPTQAANNNGLLGAAPPPIEKPLAIKVNEDQRVDIHLDKYLPKTLQGTEQAKRLQVVGLPSSLSYNSQQEEITGTWPTKEIAHQYVPSKTVPIQIFADQQPQIPSSHHLVLATQKTVIPTKMVIDHNLGQPLLQGSLVGQTNWLYPNPSGPKNINLTAGKAFSHTYTVDSVVVSQTNSLFINLYATSLAEHIASVTFSGLSGSGITCGNLNQSARTITCSGTPVAGTYYSNITETVDFLGQPIPATLPNFAFVVGPSQSPPTYNGGNPAAQAHKIGDAITSVNFASYFTNPPSSGALSISASDIQQAQVIYTPSAGGGSAQTTSLAASHLGEADGSGNKLSFSSTNLVGKIPDTQGIQGTYQIKIRAKNNAGIASSGPTLTITVSPASKAPIYKGGTPAAQTKLPGDAITAVQFAAYFTNPASSGTMLLKADDASIVGVEYKSPISSSFAAKTSLSTSAIGGANGVVVSGSPATQLSGVVPATATSGTYKVLVRMANTAGFTAANGPDWTINVKGVPLANGKSPADVASNPGEPISQVDYTDYFANPPESGFPAPTTMKIDSSKVNEISVEYRASSSGSFGAAQSLDDSALGGADGLKTNDSNILSGNIPSGAALGQYRITVKPRNQVGVAATAVSFILSVSASPSPPVWNKTVPVPAKQALKPGAAMTEVNFAPNFTNPPNSGKMRLDASDASVLNVTFTNPAGTASSSSLDTSNLKGGILLSGSGSDYEDMSLSGTVPSPALPGKYVFTIKPKNDHATAVDGPTWELDVQGVPELKSGITPPAEQGGMPGADLPHPVNIGSFYNNPPSSGDLKVSRTDLNQVTVRYTPVGGGQGSAQTLDQSNLKTLTINGTTLEGKLPTGNVNGTYQLTVRAANDIGVAKTTDSVSFTITIAGPPIYKTGQHPDDQTLKPAQALNPSPVDFAPFYTNPPGGGQMSINPTDIDTLKVTYDPTPGTGGEQQITPLNASHLNGGVVVENNTEIGGTIPASAPVGVYTLEIHMQNAIGGKSTGDGPVWHLNVISAPVFLKNPDGQVKNTGDPIASIHYTDFYANPVGAQAMTIDPTNQAQAEVVFSPLGGGASTTTPFSTSALAKADSSGHKLVISDTTLSGTIPSDAPLGNYQIKVAPTNNVGVAATVSSFILQVSSVPARTATQAPSQTVFFAAQDFMPDGKAFDLDSYFTHLAPLEFNPDDTRSIEVTVTPAANTSGTLNAAQLGLHLDNSGQIISGKPDFNPQNNLEAQTAVNVAMVVHGSYDESQFSQSALTYNFKIIGPPVRNNTAAPVITGTSTGQAIPVTPVDLRTFFNNDTDGGANPLIFDLGAHPDQVQVQVQGQTTWTNFNSSILADGSSGLEISSNGTLSGSIPVKALPTSSPQVNYTIRVKSYNHAGISHYNLAKETVGYVDIPVRITTSFDNFAPCPDLNTSGQGNVFTNGSGINIPSAVIDGNNVSVSYVHNGVTYHYTGTLVNQSAGVSKSFIEQGSGDGAPNLFPQWAEIPGSGSKNILRCSYVASPRPDGPGAVGLQAIILTADYVSGSNPLPASTTLTNSQGGLCQWPMPLTSRDMTHCTLHVPSGWLRRFR